MILAWRYWCEDAVTNANETVGCYETDERHMQAIPTRCRRREDTARDEDAVTIADGMVGCSKMLFADVAILVRRRRDERQQDLRLLWFLRQHADDSHLTLADV